eukprot:1829534-Pyramimonas_sp.AAC.2
MPRGVHRMSTSWWPGSIARTRRSIALSHFQLTPPAISKKSARSKWQCLRIFSRRALSASGESGSSRVPAYARAPFRIVR